MNINDIIAEALSIVNRDNSPVNGNISFLKNNPVSGINQNHQTTNLHWRFKSSPPAAKVQEHRMAKINGINSNKN